MIPNIKNVLITGGCGFIGSNLTNYLVEKYPDINFVNIDKLDYCSSLKNISVNNNENYNFYQLNLNNEDEILNILKNHNIDLVMHLAAQSHVDNSFLNAKIFVEDNITATLCLLNACVRYGGIKKFIHCSTDEVYGETSEFNEKFDESTILNPTNPYSVSKTAAEYYVKAYHICYNLPIIITRGNNVFGPRQYPEKLIPKFILKLLSNQKCPIHGNGNNIRNFVYVDDVSKAFEIVMLKGEIGEIYNIGTKNEYSVLEITEKIIKMIKPNENIESWIEFVEDRPWNDKRYAITNEKLKELGWNESEDFEHNFKKTLEWYQDLNLKEYWNFENNPYKSYKLIEDK